MRSSEDLLERSERLLLVVRLEAETKRQSSVESMARGGGPVDLLLLL